MAGLSSAGFSLKKLTDVISELKANAESEFASLVSPGDIVNTSDTAILGRWIKTVAAPIADLWQVAEDVYNAFDINQATGVALDNITMLGGVDRKIASASTVNMVCYGTYGTTIVADSLIKSASTGKVFATDSEITLDENLCVAVQLYPTAVANSTAYSFTYQISGINPSAVSVSITSDGTATQSEIVSALINKVNTDHSTYLSAELKDNQCLVTIYDQNYSCTFTTSTLTISKVKKGVSSTCTETGANAQDANTIQSINSPVVGWETATNPYAAVPGDVLETDTELRNRYILAKYQDSVNTYEAIYAAILKLDGVKQVVIYENETDTAFISPPVPAHSFYPIVLGGNTKEVAQTIWDNKPAGIQSYGTVVETITDSQGVDHDIGFDRPTDLPLYIDIQVTSQSSYPVGGDDQIKAAVIAFIEELGIGDDVIYSRLYTPVNSVAGHYVNYIRVGTAPSPMGTSNVTVDYYKRAVLSSANINVSSL